MTAERSLYLRLAAVLALAGCVPLEDTTYCITVEDDATTCPAASDVSDLLLGDHCSLIVKKVTGEGDAEERADSGGAEYTACCYPVKADTNTGCVDGRPFQVAGEIVTADVDPTVPGWTEELGSPELEGLSETDRAALAEAWTTAALAEHASIPAFARFSLALLAAGAPAELVSAAHAAAVDEVRHARLAFALASAYAGRPVGPSGFPFGGAVAVTGDLVALAVDTFREGCVGETLSALLAEEALSKAVDPRVRNVLRVIARDEARHAELAWRTVRWALDEGGAPVREAVSAVLREVATGGVSAAAAGGDPAVTAAHGRLGPEATRACAWRGLQGVVIPCARLLLDETVSEGAELAC